MYRNKKCGANVKKPRPFQDFNSWQKRHNRDWCERQVTILRIVERKGKVNIKKRKENGKENKTLGSKCCCVTQLDASTSNCGTFWFLGNAWCLTISRQFLGNEEAWKSLVCVARINNWEYIDTHVYIYIYMSNKIRREIGKIGNERATNFRKILLYNLNVLCKNGTKSWGEDLSVDFFSFLFVYFDEICFQLYGAKYL